MSKPENRFHINPYLINEYINGELYNKKDDS